MQNVPGDDMRLALTLEYLAGISGEDHMLTDDYYGYASQFDRYIMLVDERGSVEVREYRDSDAAGREMDSFEDGGFGASEHDAWISSEIRGYSVSFDSKYIGTYPTLRRAQAKVSLLMRETGYYPNVFLAGEHGPSVRRISVW